jgi:hypothetical protein
VELNQSDHDNCLQDPDGSGPIRSMACINSDYDDADDEHMAECLYGAVTKHASAGRSQIGRAPKKVVASPNLAQVRYPKTGRWISA